MNNYHYNLPLGIKFVVRNISNKYSRIFQTSIKPGATLDLLRSPGIGEFEIKDSLLKGELGRKLKIGELEIVESTISFPEVDSEYKEFLESVGLSDSLIVNYVPPQLEHVPNQYSHFVDPHVRTTNISVGDHIQFDSWYVSHLYSPPNVTTYDSAFPYTTALSTNSIGRIRLGKGTFKLTGQIPYAAGDGYLVYGWEHVNVSNSNAGTRVQVYVPPGGGFTTPSSCVAILDNDGTMDWILELRIYRNTGFTAIGDATYNLWPWALIEEL